MSDNCSVDGMVVNCCCTGKRERKIAGALCRLGGCAVGTPQCTKLIGAGGDDHDGLIGVHLADLVASR